MRTAFLHWKFESYLEAEFYVKIIQVGKMIQPELQLEFPINGIAVYS